jgi:hypothetical protein
VVGAGGGAAGQRVADVDALDQVAREVHSASSSKLAWLVRRAAQ